jgi:hypothetical protein
LGWKAEEKFKSSLLTLLIRVSYNVIMMMFTIMMSMNFAYHDNYFHIFTYITEDDSAGSVVDANYNADDDIEVE